MLVKKKHYIFMVTMLFIGLGVVLAQTLVAMSVIVFSDTSRNAGPYTASYKYANVRLTPISISDNGVNKTRIQVFKKGSTGTYSLKSTKTISLSLATINKPLGNIGSGTWKFQINQNDDNGNAYATLNSGVEFISLNYSY